MSIAAINDALALDLTCTEKMVLISFASHLSNKDYLAGKRCSVWPSPDEVAEKSGLTTDGVKKIIARLANKGVRVLKKKGGGRNKTSIYELRIPRNSAPDTGYKKPGIRNPVSNTVYLDGENSVSGPPTLINQEEQEIKAQTKLRQRFDRFYDAYPCKKDKAKAEKSFTKIKPDSQLFEQIMDGLQKEKTEREWKKVRGHFVPEWKYPATWLNNRCWENEFEEPPEDQQTDIYKPAQRRELAT
jgi:hypothetical protein